MERDRNKGTLPVRLLPRTYSNTLILQKGSTSSTKHLTVWLLDVAIMGEDPFFYVLCREACSSNQDTLNTWRDKEKLTMGDCALLRS